MLKSLDRKGAILFAMSLNILPGSGVFVAWVALTMERRNRRLLFVQKPNSYPKPYLDANWQNSDRNHASLYSTTNSCQEKKFTQQCHPSYYNM